MKLPACLHLMAVERLFSYPSLQVGGVVLSLLSDNGAEAEYPHAVHPLRLQSEVKMSIKNYLSNVKC